MLYSKRLFTQWYRCVVQIWFLNGTKKSNSKHTIILPEISRCTRAFALGCCKTCTCSGWRRESAERNLSSIACQNMRFTPNHTFLLKWLGGKQLLNKLSWQIPASSNYLKNLSSSKFVRLCMWCNLVHQNNTDGLHWCL